MAMAIGGRKMSGYTKIGIYVPINTDAEKVLGTWEDTKFFQVYEIRHVKIFVNGTKMDAILIEAVVLSRSGGSLARELMELFDVPNQQFTPCAWGVTVSPRGL